MIYLEVEKGILYVTTILRICYSVDDRDRPYKDFSNGASYRAL